MISLVFHSFSITLLLVLLHISICLGNIQLWYESCGSLFNCGNTKIGFPFWGRSRPSGCGYPTLELKCEENNITTIQISGVDYRVLDINSDNQILRIVRENLMERICFQTFTNTTMDSTLFDHVEDGKSLTIYYGCPPSYIPGMGEFTCSGDTIVYVETGAQSPDGCNASVVVPILGSLAGEIGGSLSLPQIVGEGFEVKYKIDSAYCRKCTNWYGRCGNDLAANMITCICPNQTVGFGGCEAASPTTWAISPGVFFVPVSLE